MVPDYQADSERVFFLDRHPRRSRGSSHRRAMRALHAADSRREQLRRASVLVRKYVPENVSLVDESIAERRAEAARDSRRTRCFGVTGLPQR